MKVLVLLNTKSGTLTASRTGDEPGRIERGFAARGLSVEVRCLDGQALQSAAEAARDGAAGAGGADAVVAGGGDGTLNAVANVLAAGGEPRVPFGVLPLGTHNHFAKELGVPLDLDGAVAALADALAAGRVRDLDVGTVNGRLFLNFSGIGLHPDLVRLRDAEYAALGRHQLLKRFFRKPLKLLALAIAFAKSLRRLPVRRVRLVIGEQTLTRVTPSVIVCNNAHQMKIFGLENVSRPGRGVLNVYVARSTGALGLVRLLLASFLRRLDGARDFESLPLAAVRIESRRPRMSVSVDGEVVKMDTPLEYAVRIGGLRVVETCGPGD